MKAHRPTRQCPGFAIAGSFLILASTSALADAQCFEGPGFRFAAELPAAPRMLHRAVWAPAAEAFYVVGGLAGLGSATVPLDEVWRYDPQTDQWRALRTSGGPGGVSNGFGIAWDSNRNRILIRGGRTSPTLQESLRMWSLGPEGGAWESHGEMLPYALSRQDMTLEFDPVADVAWTLFGRSDMSSRRYFGFDFRHGSWVSGGSAPIAFGARSGHISAWRDEFQRVLVYGGIASGYVFSDEREWERYRNVWSGSPAANEWMPLPLGPFTPESRQHAVGGYDPYLDALIVQGGEVLYYPGTVPSHVTDELLVYLLAEGRWERREYLGLPTRFMSSGGYCPATGELFVFGGSDSLNGSALGPKLSTTLVIPIETPASFAWLAPSRSERAVRHGRISGADLGSDVRNVRLMDRASGRVLATAEKVQRLGSGVWSVRFAPETSAERDVRSAGRLVASGVYQNGSRAFLAPVESGGARELDARGGVALHAVDRPVDVLEPGEVRAVRDAGRWHIQFRPMRSDRAGLTVFDVSGRARARLDGPFRSTDSGEFEVEWPASGAAAGLPPGLYFVRPNGGRSSEAAKLILL